MWVLLATPTCHHVLGLYPADIYQSVSLSKLCTDLLDLHWFHRNAVALPNLRQCLSLDGLQKCDETAGSAGQLLHYSCLISHLSHLATDSTVLPGMLRQAAIGKRHLCLKGATNTNHMSQAQSRVQSRSARQILVKIIPAFQCFPLDFWCEALTLHGMIAVNPEHKGKNTRSAELLIACHCFHSRPLESSIWTNWSCTKWDLALTLQCITCGSRSQPSFSQIKDSFSLRPRLPYSVSQEMCWKAEITSWVLIPVDTF